MFTNISVISFNELISKSVDDIFSELEDNIAFTYEKVNKKRKLEVELRLQYLGFTEYQRISNWLNENKPKFDDVEVSKTVDYFHEKYRYSLDDDNKIIAIINKETIAKKDIKELDIRLSVNLEHSYKINPDLDHKDIEEKAEYHRNKTRTSYNFKNVIRIDITEVSSIEKGKTNYAYECEIEFLSISNTGIIDDDSKKIGKTFLNNLMKKRQNSESFYKQNLLRDMIESLNHSLNKNSGDPKIDRKGLSYKFLAPARNLKYPDVVTGGLINGKVKYNVTQKVDGERKFFLLYGGGIWLVYPPNDFNLIATYNNNLQEVMIDGEDVSLDNRMKDCNIKTKHMYVPFDMVLLNSGKEMSNKIQNISHNDRISKVIGLLDKLKNSLVEIGITVLYKEFREVGDTFESLSSAVLYMDSNKNSMCYKTDGMIFTPINSNYNTGTEKYAIKDRVLTSYPDICKFKEWENLTIDLYVNIEERIAYGRGIKNELTPFIGSYRNVFNSHDNIDWESNFFDTFNINGIVEFKPKKITEDGNVRYLLTPLKARPDKIQSNRTDYAGAIWDDINDPLDIETFRGNTFRLLRHSFNHIKRDLYSEIPNDSDIFEIGTGHGGQIYRWTRFNKIFGVEPDQKHIDEMNERIKKYDSSIPNKLLGSKIKVIEAGGENTKEIVEGCTEWFKWKESSKLKPFYIVSMLSLSFFWKDISTFNGLVSTFQGLARAYRKVGGKDINFVFMTIRGSPVTRLFGEVPSINGVKNLVLGPCTMSLHPIIEGNLTPTLEIDIKETIVDKQKEYLVSLSDLVKYIPLEGLTSSPSNVEDCMSEAERKYSALFVSGRAKIGFSDRNTPIRKMVSDSNEDIKIHLAKKEVERIDFRYRGRADFLTSKWLNLEIYHQSPEEKYLAFVDDKYKETSSYKQSQFGYSKNKEYQALGVLSLDSLGKDMADAIRGKNRKGGVVFSAASLVNAILTCTDSKYQQMEDEIEKYSYCSEFYESALRRLADQTEYPSDKAKILNMAVREWLPPLEIESLIYSKLVDENLVSDKDVIYDEGYFIYEVIYIGDDFKEPTDRKGGNLELIKEVKIEKLSTKEKGKMKTYLIKPNEEPDKISKLTRYYKWKGDSKNHKDYINKFSNKDLHDLLLKVDRINDDSIFYNCRDGQLFRYYHSIGKTLPEIRKELTLFGRIDDEDNEEEFYTDHYQFAFLSDVYGISIKAFSIDKECIEKINQKDCIAERLYCVFKPEYSFVTSEKNFIHVYYHHYETSNKGEDSWFTTNTDNTFIRGIYVPLGVLNKDGMVRTLFNK